MPGQDDTKKGIRIMRKSIEAGAKLAERLWEDPESAEQIRTIGKAVVGAAEEAANIAGELQDDQAQQVPGIDPLEDLEERQALRDLGDGFGFDRPPPPIDPDPSPSPEQEQIGLCTKCKQPWPEGATTCPACGCESMIELEDLEGLAQH